MTELVTQLIGFVSALALVVLALMGYYAMKVLGRLKGGLLQEGWKWIAAAAFMVLVGQGILTSNYLLNLNTEQAQYVALYSYCIKIVAGALFLIGFRAQYMIWRLKIKKEEDEPKI